MLVVADSGIWISAMKFGGTPAVALEKALTEHTTRVSMKKMKTQEIQDKLTMKQQARAAKTAKQAKSPKMANHPNGFLTQKKLNSQNNLGWNRRRQNIARLGRKYKTTR